jgi:hypothetical protein
MKLEHLKQLHESMITEGVTRRRFNYTFNKVIFDVFFFTDEVPYKLMFGAIGFNFSFELSVKKNYEINPFLEADKFHKLVNDVLKLKYDKNNKFKISTFFINFDNQIPNNFKATHIVNPHDIAVYRSDLEECNKIYFLRWLDNDSKNNKRSPENLEKTKALLGYDAYISVLNRNISSVWTDKREKAKIVHPY